MFLQYAGRSRSEIALCSGWEERLMVVSANRGGWIVSDAAILRYRYGEDENAAYV